MCIVCKLGEGATADMGNLRLNEIFHAIRGNPLLPVRLRCNVNSLFRFQNPGPAEDTPGGELFNVKRDLEILMRLGMMPGDTWPATDLVRRLYEHVNTTHGICDCDGPSSPEWAGCPRAESGFYEKGLALGFDTFIRRRTFDEMERTKRDSARTVYEASTLRIRPHHLMCMTCFYGRMGTLAPIAPDNLYEPIDVIHQNPQIPITLVNGCCMVCPPCPEYDPATNLCAGFCSMGLRDERKDLVVLQRMGMKYGDTLPAREMFRRLFAAFETTVLVCSNGDGIVRGPGWTTCDGPEGNAAYVKGRAAKLGISGL